MKKLLYISYLFPPVGGSGVQRSLKFAKYLPEYGWEPIMLVANHRFLKQPKDYSLSQDIDPKLIIYRTFSLDIRWFYKLLWGLKLHKLVNLLNSNFLIPDPDIMWLPYAKYALKRIFKEHKIDLVFITAPPYSSLFLGDYVKQRFGVDYCVDFRDLWTKGVGRADNPPPQHIQAKEKEWEKQILIQAKQVLCVNEAMVSKLQQFVPEILRNKFSGITNGYDDTDFASAPAYKRQNEMHIVFTGSLYGRFQPDIIWQALSELIEEGKISAHKIRFEIYGANSPNFVLGRYAADSAIKSIVKILAYLPHHTSIEMICLADALLVLSPVGNGSNTDSHSKLFEYMRSERPILAVVDLHSIGAQILRKSGTSFIADASSCTAVKATIHEMYIKWENAELYVNPDIAYINSFERKALTAKLASVLNSACNR
ncbi:MAG: hypothetical protein RBS43_03665 [Candidatus Cloacimonas sp.]|nr:hypothetical protein [Candidatus Cloacimonas sp.]